MQELFVISVYLAAVLAFSLAFHARCRCVKASALSGLGAAFVTTSLYAACESRSLNPLEYVASFVWFGVTPALVGALLSGLIGLPLQCRKVR